MEPNVIIYPPNRPLERNLRYSHLPKFFNFTFFIDTNTEGSYEIIVAGNAPCSIPPFSGNIILGSSNVAGTFWEGSLFQYKDHESARRNAYENFFISNTTTADAKFLTEDTVSATNLGTAVPQARNQRRFC